MLSFGGLGALLVGLGLAARGASGRGAVVTADAVQYFSYLWEFFFPSLLLFVLVFPREPKWFRKIPFFEMLVFTPYIFHLVLTTVARVTNQTFWIPDVAARTGWAAPLLSTVRVALDLLFDAHQLLFSLVNLAYVVVTLSVLGVRLRESTSPRLRDQLRAISIGLGACLVLYSIAVPLPTAFGLATNVGEGPRSALLGPSDAYRIATAALEDDALADDARWDRLILSARFAGPGADGGLAPRVGPFVGRARVGQTSVWALKGIGAEASVKLWWNGDRP